MSIFLLKININNNHNFPILNNIQCLIWTFILFISHRSLLKCSKMKQCRLEMPRIFWAGGGAIRLLTHRIGSISLFSGGIGSSPAMAML